MLSFIRNFISFFLKWLYHFTVPPAMYKSSSCSSTSSTFVVVSIFNLSQLVSVH